MIPSNVAALITKHEGRRRTSYVDTRGNVTIGVGRNLNARPITVTDAQVDQWFQEDVNAFASDLVLLPWFTTLDNVRQAVMIDLCFNLGLHGLLAFERMLAAVVAQDWQTAADELLNSAAYHQEPNRIREDAAILLTGVL